jgi:hypothetical protein
MSYWTLVYLLTEVCLAAFVKDQDNLTKTKQQEHCSRLERDFAT